MSLPVPLPWVNASPPCLRSFHVDNSIVNAEDSIVFPPSFITSISYKPSILFDVKSTWIVSSSIKLTEFTVCPAIFTVVFGVKYPPFRVSIPVILWFACWGLKFCIIGFGKNATGFVILTQSTLIQTFMLWLVVL